MEVLEILLEKSAAILLINLHFEQCSRQYRWNEIFRPRIAFDFERLVRIGLLDKFDVEMIHKEASDN